MRFARAHGIANGRFSALAGDNVKGELWLLFNQGLNLLRSILGAVKRRLLMEVGRGLGSVG